MAYFGEGTGPIHVDNVRCTGAERSLADCVKQELGRHNCRHSEDAGVICDYFGKKASGNSSAGESPLGPAQAEAAAPAPRPEQTPRTADRVWGIHAAWAPRAVLGGRGPPCAHSAEGRAPGAGRGGLGGPSPPRLPWSRAQPFLDDLPCPLSGSPLVEGHLCSYEHFEQQR